MTEPKDHLPAPSYETLGLNSEDVPMDEVYRLIYHSPNPYTTMDISRMSSDDKFRSRIVSRELYRYHPNKKEYIPWNRRKSLDFLPAALTVVLLGVILLVTGMVKTSMIFFSVSVLMGIKFLLDFFLWEKDKMEGTTVLTSRDATDSYHELYELNKKLAKLEFPTQVEINLLWRSDVLLKDAHPNPSFPVIGAEHAEELVSLVNKIKRNDYLTDNAVTVDDEEVRTTVEYAINELDRVIDMILSSSQKSKDRRYSDIFNSAVELNNDLKGMLTKRGYNKKDKTVVSQIIHEKVEVLRLLEALESSLAGDTEYTPPTFSHYNTARLKDVSGPSAYPSPRRGSLRKKTTPQVKETRKQRENISALSIDTMIKEITDVWSTVNSHYTEMETSPTTIIEAPAILDVTVPTTAAFHELFQTLRDDIEMFFAQDHPTPRYVSGTRDQVMELKSLWEKAVNAAYEIGLNGLSVGEKRRAQNLLRLVLDSPSDSEAASARDALNHLLDKVMYRSSENEERYLNITGSRVLERGRVRALAAADQSSKGTASQMTSSNRDGMDKRN